MMAEKYLGEYAKTNNFKFQELVRIMDATLSEVNPDGLLTGDNTLSIIRFLRDFVGMDKFLGKETLNHIDYNIERSKDKENVRGEVKNILMYPRLEYLPWVDHNIHMRWLDVIANQAKSMLFQIRLVEGHIYGICISDKNLIDVVFDTLCQYQNIFPKDTQKNSKMCHITIVNSNIVSNIDKEDVNDIIKTFNRPFNISTGEIKSTFSEDCSLCSECYVIEIKSLYIDKFLSEFNKRFDKGIKIQKHITFAINPRSLW